jgi:hypothetical protein
MVNKRNETGATGGKGQKLQGKNRKGKPLKTEEEKLLIRRKKANTELARIEE